MEKSGNLAVRGVIALIGLYRLLSALGVRRCRFYPTCSAYAQDALHEYGFWRGIHLAFRRLVKCHPWHAGGYDPVHPHTS